MTRRRDSLRAPRSDIKAQTEIVFGLRASLSVLEVRPEDVLRVACDATTLDDTRAVYAGPVHQLSSHELARIAQSDHHEGICVEAKPRRWLAAADLAAALGRSGVGIALDRVRNAYNIGAILRTAAFLGIDVVVLGAPAPHPALAPDAVRVAEGGAEHLRLSRTTDLASTLSRLRERGVRVYGADGQARQRALGLSFDKPSVLVMGNEREGLSERVRAECDHIVAIPGTGKLESLNVAAASALLMAELLRDRLVAV